MTRSKRTEQREKAKGLLRQASAASNQRKAKELVAQAMEVLEITADSPGAEEKIRNLMNEVQKEDQRRRRDPDDQFFIPSDANWQDDGGQI
jgi:2-keto-3-deoxy-6-phosphogluconate aldolase